MITAPCCFASNSSRSSTPSLARLPSCSSSTATRSIACNSVTTSSPWRARARLSLSAWSAKNCSSPITERGITSVPPMNPVPATATILPSISTDVSTKIARSFALIFVFGSRANKYDTSPKINSVTASNTISFVSIRSFLFARFNLCWQLLHVVNERLAQIMHAAHK